MKRMKLNTIKKMDNWLPPTAVQAELKQRVVAAATEDGVSISEIQRRALALFLRARDTSSTINDNPITA